MKAGKYRVTYSVRFTCEVELEAGDFSDDRWSDTLCDIDIPEGGTNESHYVVDSFEVEEHIHEDDE